MIDTSHIALEARDVSKQFGGVAALENVNIEVHRGKVNAVVGENGAGKSTLMKILSGVYVDYDGTLLLRGSNIQFRGPADARAHGIAIIHQELQLVPTLSIAQNIFLGRELKNSHGWMDRQSMSDQAQELLIRMGMLLDVDTPVGYLRVGEQQLIEICKALSIQAQVIIMDEPTSALSPSEVQRLFKIIRELTAAGVAIVYISHKLQELEEIADRYVVLRDGQLVGVKEDAKGTPRDELIRMMAGKDIVTSKERRTELLGEEIFRVEKVTLKHPTLKGRYLVHNVCFSVHRGEIVGIFGLIGAGRTELLECIFGLHPQRAEGRVFVEGSEASVKSTTEAMHAGISLVPEDRKASGLLYNLSIGDNICLTAMDSVVNTGLVDRKKKRHLAVRALESLNVKAQSPLQSCDELSGGNQQKVVLAKWLASRPKVMLLDEPTRGVDVAAKSEIYSLIQQLADQGIAIVVVSSDMAEITTIADRILVMREGEVSAIFNQAAASEAEILEAAVQ